MRGLKMQAENTRVVSSSAFKNGELMPKKYSQYGDNVNPELKIEGIPTHAKTLALIMTDLDIPLGMTITQWVMWNIQPTGGIAENSAPGVQGKDSRRKNSYMGPRPPFGTHRYLFKVYALDTALALEPSAGRKDLEKAIEKHILAQGELMGIYRK
jgi:Raf kinase inhibitor-like YbhB/YbcL family protein